MFMLFLSNLDDSCNILGFEVKVNEGNVVHVSEKKEKRKKNGVRGKMEGIISGANKDD